MWSIPCLFYFTLNLVFITCNVRCFLHFYRIPGSILNMVCLNHVFGLVAFLYYLYHLIFSCLCIVGIPFLLLFWLVFTGAMLDLSSIILGNILWLKHWIGDWQYPGITLLWRHNGRDGVSDHQPHDCLLDRLFRRRLKNTSKLRVTSLCEGNSPVTGEFLTQRASNPENVSICWRHHVLILCWVRSVAPHGFTGP